jgi:hypothetical protein
VHVQCNNNETVIVTVFYGYTCFKICHISQICFPVNHEIMCFNRNIFICECEAPHFNDNKNKENPYNHSTTLYGLISERVIHDTSGL